MRSRGREWWFPWALAAVTAGAFAVRVAYVLVERRDFVPGGDAYFYHASANLIADGEWFVSPFAYPELRRPAAEHPPLYTLYLALPSLLGLRGVVAHMLWSCVAGAGTVAVTGVVGRMVRGAPAGIGAAAVAALYPNIWAPDGMLQAETLAMLLVMVAVALAYRTRRRPTRPNIAVLGVVCGAAALTRSELVLLAPLLVVPVAWARRDTERPARPRRARLALAAVGVASFLAVIAPWSAYNASRFERPVLLSSQFGPLLSAANCDSTYYGAFRGYFDINCSRAIDAREGLTLADDQSVVDGVHRRAALDYVREHRGRLPAVEAIRLLRLVGLWHPSAYVRMDALLDGRELWVSRAALWSFYAVALAALAGAVVLARERARSMPLFPLLVPIGAVVATVLVTYASTRFRAVAEPSLAVLAAVAGAAAFDAVSRRSPPTGP
jgi:hypothetical protein